MWFRNRIHKTEITSRAKGQRKRQKNKDVGNSERRRAGDTDRQRQKGE